MSSVAFPAQPTGPGWWRTAWLMFLGWLAAALVLGGLYLAGSLVGVIGRNGYAVGGASAFSINDWPFAEDGTWSLFADVSVLMLAVGVTTLTVAWQLRGRHATVHEGRLFLVLLLTGGAPFVTSQKAAPLWLLVAVWAVRGWVVRDELRLPRRLLAALGAVLLAAIGSYGLVHPVWVEAVSVTTSTPKTRRPTVLLILRNVSRAPIRLERVDGGLFAEARAGWPWESGTALPIRISSRHSAELTLRMRSGSCGDGLVGSVRYRLLGRTLHEPLRVVVPGLPGCS